MSRVDCKKCIAYDIEFSCGEACEVMEQLQKELVYLRNRDRLLSALEDAGVDNWEGYGEIDV